MRDTFQINVAVIPVVRADVHISLIASRLQQHCQLLPIVDLSEMRMLRVTSCSLETLI